MVALKSFHTKVKKKALSFNKIFLNYKSPKKKGENLRVTVIIEQIYSIGKFIQIYSSVEMLEKG